ncbi:MAG: LamG domain-containing protein [Firmicutes bacterium]|nr:LamG domain-containing protein [Bacillota bacterium]
MNPYRAILCGALVVLLLAGADSEAARDFAAAGDKVSTPFTAHATQRSYSLWTFRRGDGGGGFGRMFEKRTTSTEVETFHNRATGTANGDTYMYTRAFSGTSGFWTIPRPSANIWHHICIVYEAVAGSLPTIHVDGIPQTVTALSTTSGSPNTNTDAYVIGGRGNDNLRAWDGRLAEFAIWNALLTASECQALARGASPNTIRRQSLVGYWPLWGVSSPEPGLPGGTATPTGTTAARHAPVGPYVRAR